MHSDWSVLLLLFPRPPLSTLFPYSTLFRSTRADLERGSGTREAVRGAMGALARERVLTLVRRWPHGREADRKSTRQNSSHGYISYAVFRCNRQHHITPDEPPRPTLYTYSYL